MRVLPVISLIPTAAIRGAVREVLRHPVPEADIAATLAIEVPPEVTLVHLYATVPLAARGRPGGTRAQTRATLLGLEATLRRLGLGLEDVVRMQVFLVGDPARGGRMDAEGFMAAFGEFFGTAERPALPVRSIVQVAGLIDPEALVEIEVSAARTRR